MDSQDWHRRFRQQLSWTRPLRDYLFEQLAVSQVMSALEIGCGTGALLSELSERGIPQVVGLDISITYLEFARSAGSSRRLAQGDALALPFANHAFDLSVCHFVLLWLNDPLLALRELRRVTRPGGVVIAFAEPDYGGRIDYPEPLAALGIDQSESLRLQGADPHLGRKIKKYFLEAGLQANGGIIGSQWSGDSSSTAPDDLEWQVIEADLQSLPTRPAQGAVEELRALDAASRRAGERLSFTPTFYAWSRVD